MRLYRAVKNTLVSQHLLAHPLNTTGGRSPWRLHNTGFEKRKNKYQYHVADYVRYPKASSYKGSIGLGPCVQLQNQELKHTVRIRVASFSKYCASYNK